MRTCTENIIPKASFFKLTIVVQIDGRNKCMENIIFKNDCGNKRLVCLRMILLVVCIFHHVHYNTWTVDVLGKDGSRLERIMFRSSLADEWKIKTEEVWGDPPQYKLYFSEF